MPEAFISAFNSLLSIPSPHAMSPRSFERSLVLPRSIGIATVPYANQSQIYLDEQSVRSHLLALLHMASMECLPSSEHLTVLRSAKTSLSVLEAIVQTSLSLRQKLLVSLAVEEVQGPLSQFINSWISVPYIGQEHIAIGICPRVHTEAVLGLHHSVCELLLKTGFYASGDGITFDPALGLALLTKRSKTTSALSPCKYHDLRIFTSQAPVSLFEAGSTPQVLTTSHDWRERLVNELSRDTKHQYGSIVMMVGEICRDLELRCDEIECPLRAEQAKNKDLMSKLNVSQARLAELECEIVEDKRMVDDLANEKDCFQNNLQASEQREHVQSARLTDLEKEFHALKKDAQDAAKVASETAVQQELIHLASTTEKDELLEEQEVKLIKLTEHMSSLQNDLVQLRSNELYTHKKIRSLEETVSDRDEAIGKLEAASTSLAIEKSSFVLQEASLRNENQNLELMV